MSSWRRKCLCFQPLVVRLLVLHSSPIIECCMSYLQIWGLKVLSRCSRKNVGTQLWFVWKMHTVTQFELLSITHLASWLKNDCHNLTSNVTQSWYWLPPVLRQQIFRLCCFIYYLLHISLYLIFLIQHYKIKRMLIYVVRTIATKSFKFWSFFLKSVFKSHLISGDWLLIASIM